MADYPIDLDDDDELAGSTIIKRENQTSAGRWVAESSRSAIERSAAIQREIAEIEASIGSCFCLFAADLVPTRSGKTPGKITP